jgi:uncharacterized protein YndB with AHSA1/START domain
VVAFNGMQKIHFSIFINAPKEKVWDTMLADATYRAWTTAFHPGSYFKGDWSEGSKMLFIGPDEESGGEMGMVSRIAENRVHEFISIEHLGIYKDGVEDTESPEAKQWGPAFENYTFVERDGGTEVQVDQDMMEEYKEMFEEMWPKALQTLKELAEG